MFPRNDLSRGRLAADGPCAEAIVFARCVPLAQSVDQALCSCTLWACVCINRYPSPSGRPDLFRVRPFSHDRLQRTLTHRGRRDGLSFPVFAQIGALALSRAIKVCATDLTSLVASLRGRVTTMTSHLGDRTPVAFSFA